MKNIRFFGIATAFCLALFFLNLSFSSGQDVSVKSLEEVSNPESSEPLSIKVSVDEVTIDVVVLDKKGNPRTDLTAADFEVLQDGKKQKIASCVYIDSKPDAVSQTDKKGINNLQLLPTVMLKKEDVRRTILFVVDDYGMQIGDGYYMKMALRGFVERQMQAGDLVAILRTDYGNRALNLFLSDKREALAHINAMPTTTAPKLGGIGITGVGEGMFEHFQVMRAEKLISSFNYGLKALKNMPGRKFLTMLTPMSLGVPSLKYNNGLFVYHDAYDDLADIALRNGVVVNILDSGGLRNFEHLPGADASIWVGSNPLRSLIQEEAAIKLQNWRRDKFVIPSPLPEKTGGVSILQSNFFLTGLGTEVDSLMKGYYLITYAPPPDTFDTRDGKEKYHRLKVNVKRGGSVVHTRDGFFNRLESETDDDVPQSPLFAAIHSPFKATDITVNMAAGYVKDAEAGYLVRSWIHLDPVDMKIIETENGVGRIDLEAVCVTSDIHGNIQDSKRAEITLSNIGIDWVKKHGVRFSMLLPVKKPGSYYVRISIQDKESGKVGSAYQFLEIPDLEKKGPGLSTIFMLTSADDLQWMNMDVKKEIGKGVFFPSEFSNFFY